MRALLASLLSPPGIAHRPDRGRRAEDGEGLRRAVGARRDWQTVTVQCELAAVALVPDDRVVRAEAAAQRHARALVHPVLRPVHDTAGNSCSILPTINSWGEEVRTMRRA